MNVRTLAAALALLAISALPSAALAAAPAFVPVQGYLTGADGQPVDRSVTLRFTLWDRMMAGQALYQEEFGVLVEQGSFTVYLGGAGDPALDLALFRDQGELYLGVAVDGGAELNPRLPVGAVPYAGFAQHAGDAATLGGHAATDFRLGADGVGWDDLSGVPDTLLDGDADTLAGLSCASGQVAKWDGAAWACADDSGGGGAGDITAVTAEAGLLGGATEGDASLALDQDFVLEMVATACNAGYPSGWDAISGGVMCELPVTRLWAGNGLVTDVDEGDVTIQLDRSQLDGWYLNENQTDSVNSTMILNGAVGVADINTVEVQSRVTGHCTAEGTFMTRVYADGTVQCNSLGGGMGDITAVHTVPGSGLQGGGQAGELSISLDFALLDARYAPLAHDHDAAYVNAGEPDSVDTAMIVDGTVGLADIDTAEVQVRVTGTCGEGQTLNAINFDGTATCATDDDTAAPGSTFEIWGGTSWGTLYISTADIQITRGYGRLINRTTAGSTYYSHEVPIPTNFAGRPVRWDTLTVNHACTTGEYIAATYAHTNPAPNSTSFLGSDLTDRSGTGSYTLNVNALVSGSPSIEVEIVADDVNGWCEIVWGATYHY